jgi:hypothetical protein
MAKRRERPIPRLNPSGERVWVARPTDADGKRHYRGTFTLKREAQDAIDAAYDEWEHALPARDTIGRYAADWTGRHPRSERTNYDRNSKLRQVLDVEIEGRLLRDWPFAELHRSHARELVDHMLRQQGRAAGGARAIVRVLSAMTEDAIDDRCATVNPFKGVRLRGNDPRVSNRGSAAGRHFSGLRRAFYLQIRRLTMLAGRKPVGTRVARFRPTDLPVSESPVGMRFSSGPAATPADSSPDHPTSDPPRQSEVRVDTRRTSCTMSESPVFTGDSGSARAYVLRNSGYTFAGLDQRLKVILAVLAPTV